MELKIKVSDLLHVPEKSIYNLNYYKLPIEINGCSILFGKSDDDNTTLWELGKFVDNEFVRDCYLGESFTYSKCQDCEYINLLAANKEMVWS